MIEKFSLEGKVAVITGGAGLLGKEHALALLESKATVYISDVNSELLDAAVLEIKEELSEANVFPIYMDVTSKESIIEAKDIILSKMGRVDILVNNAAIDPKVKSGGDIEESRFEQYDLESWNFQVNVGLTGAFLCSQVFGSWMAKNGGGNILNISSDLGVIAPDQRIYRKKDLAEEMQPVKPVTYSVIKSGLIGLTKYLATYWAKEGVRVNAISPGGVFVNQPHEFVEKLTSLIPMGRMAKRDEYRGCVQFLCSEASSYVTGHNLLSEGGRTVW